MLILHCRLLHWEPPSSHHKGDGIKKESSSLPTMFPLKSWKKIARESFKIVQLKNRKPSLPTKNALESSLKAFKVAVVNVFHIPKKRKSQNSECSNRIKCHFCMLSYLPFFQREYKQSKLSDIPQTQ